MFPLAEHANKMPMIVSAAFGILGIIAAALLYVFRPLVAESLKNSAGGLYTLVYNKYYVDEAYQAVVVKPLKGISRIVLWKGMDEGVIDGGLVNGLGRAVRAWGSILRYFQSGSIRNYATWVLAGCLLVIFAMGLFGVGR
jgi:NADH-quinone oxidoreductase subunit L